MEIPKSASAARSKNNINLFSGPFIPVIAAILLFLPGSLQAAIPQQERDALLALYNGTNGTNWSSKSGWMGPAGTECTWSGVTCNAAKTSVLEINLSFNGLNGSIPSTLGNLTQLTALSLYGNQLSGSIPVTLGNLGLLTSLDLGSNQLSGNIPVEFGNLTKLQTLYLYNNRLSGSIPSALGNLTQLTSLGLNGNQLSGTIPPELGNLTQLTSLDLEGELFGNQLNGSIPDRLGNLTKLQWLDLNGNQLTGSIPATLGNLSLLLELRLSGNQLSGTIPTELGNLTMLEDLRLNDNQLSGSIPSTLEKLTQLGYLDLSGNQLSGSIPSILGRLTQISYLDLSGNQLSGSIPPELGDAIGLGNLNLSDNQLSGTIPPTLGNIPYLSNLNLSRNQLSGSIPTTLGNLSPYGYSLNLSGNQLTGSIPPTLGSISYMDTLDLSGNQLTGSIPSTLGNITYIGRLDLSGNQLSGSIPAELGNMTWLEFLDLSMNRLSGSIPPALGNLTNLGYLSLYGNQLSGAMPSNLKSLQPSQLYIFFNALYANDNGLNTFLSKAPQWATTQTVSPTNVSGTPSSYSAILVSWIPISFQSSAGRYEVWLSTTSGGPYSLYQSTASKTAGSLVLNGLDPGKAYGLVARSVTDPHGFNHNMVVSEFSAPVSAAAGSSISLDRTLNSGGAATAITMASQGTTLTGYVAVGVNSGMTPYGTAVFSYRQNGVTVSEAGVPASPPTTAARIFIDYRSSVAAIPWRISAGTININTGIAVVNYGSASANVTYTLRNMAGATLSIGHGTLAAGAHFARFIDQLTEVAPDFVLPSSFQIATQFASLEISSDQPISILALRMTINQRNEVLYTTTPTADLTQPLTSTPIYFPQLADGGGNTTSFILLNTSNVIETGTLQILDDDGNPFVINEVGGMVNSKFRYSIASGGVVRLQTDGSPAIGKAGWAQLTPDAGSSTPIGAGVFSYNPGNFLVTESGIPATVSTTHARIYVDLSGGHNTGLAIANPTNTNASITITAFQSDGVTGIGTSQGPLQIPANGHSAHFADEFIAGLPAEFTGVLDIISSTPFAALTVRSLYNERNDFLVATFPVADMTRGAPAPIVFPQIADGGGYVTQFILIGAGGASSVTLNFYGEDGKPLAVGK